MGNDSFVDKLQRIEPTWWGAAAAVAGAGAVVVPSHRVIAAAVGGGLVLWLAWRKLPCCAACAGAAPQATAAPQYAAQPFVPPAQITRADPSPSDLQAVAARETSIAAYYQERALAASSPVTPVAAPALPVAAPREPATSQAPAPAPAPPVSPQELVTPPPTTAQIVNGLIMPWAPVVEVGPAVSIARDGSFSSGTTPKPAPQAVLRML